MSRMALAPSLAEFAVNIKSGVDRVLLDGGPARYRRDLLGCVSLVNATWRGGPEEYEYLRAFYRAMTRNGSQPFDINLKIMSTSTLYTNAYFVPGSFKSMGKDGGTYTVAAQLAVLVES